MASHSKQHFEFIDGLRFTAALWVAVSHFGAPPLNLLLSFAIPEKHAMKMQGIFGSMFNGTQAVIVFFIISGFCIHLSYANYRHILDIRSFYYSRFIRICIPMAFAVGISALLPSGLNTLKNVLWSLYAEIIYYAIYPILLLVIRKCGVTWSFCFSLAISLVLSLFPDSHKGYFWTYGVLGTAVLGLPVWLLGCVLAEKVSAVNYESSFESRAVCQLLRCSMLITCAATTYFHYNTLVHFKISMLLVAPLCAVWLYSELLQEKCFILFQLFSKAGKAAYSLYLMHMLSIVALAHFSVSDSAPYKTAVLLCISLVLTTVFYLAVERPAHRLATSVRRLMLQANRDVDATIVPS